MYTPNFNDPRIQKRTKTAIGFAVSCFSDKPREWSTRSLDRWIGYTHKPLGRYLREKLLITVNDEYLWGTCGVKCKQYRLNRSGVSDLINACDEFSIHIPTNLHIVPTMSLAQTWVKSAFPEIHTGVFEYKDRADRLWHPLQNVRSEIRKPLLAEQGYRYEYDIECAAPTLIFQQARESGLTQRSKVDLIEEFLEDPQSQRQQLAQRIGTTQETAKKIINARFAGATLRQGRSIDQFLDYNTQALEALKHDPWFCEFSKQIKKCWDKIKLHEGMTRLSPRDKWRIYFQQERCVMGVVRRELDKQRCRYFLEHDGWRCDSWIDPRELELKILKRFNKRLKFTYKIWDV